MDNKNIEIQSFLKLKSLITNQYHLTFDDFDNFDFSKSVFGMHFGSKESAINRKTIKILEDEKLGGYALANKKNNPILLNVELSIKNPIYLNENRTGRWTPFDIIKEVINKAESDGLKGFTDDEIDSYYEDLLEHNGVKLIELDTEPYGGEEYDQSLKEHFFVRDWIESKGYDSIAYNNDFELGGISFIAFREEQIKIKSKEYLSKSNKLKNLKI